MAEPARQLRLILHQTAPHLGEAQENRLEMLARVGAAGDADLLVFPELALTGYNLRSRVQRLAVPLGDSDPVGFPEGAPSVAFGLPERGRDELVYNAALLVHGGRILAKHRKVYLPTYGPFDEGRYYARGTDLPPVVTLPSGWRVGLLVCEDFWHPGLLYLLAMQGAEIILVLSAAPGRGDPWESGGEGRVSSVGSPSPGQPPGADGDPGDGPLFSSSGTWALLARTAALQYGLYLVLANRGGVEEGLTFAGASLVVGPEGRVLAQAPQAEPATLAVTLHRTALRQARTPFAHLRDEDPAFLRRALDRLSGGEPRLP